jgi:DNA excision repair protein ERCC-6
MAEPLPEIWAIDEAMEPYYGRHSLKQFIRGKPVRFGYKFWCLCSQEGALMKFILYEGKGTGRDEGMGVGETVVSTLALQFVPVGSHGFVDNYFTSLPLLVKFKASGINLTGTLRKDRIRHVPLANYSKVQRGESEIFVDEKKNIAVVHWQDNSDVIVGTNNMESVLGLGNCNRWSAKHKKVANILQPKIIQHYNNGMGGVDLFDQFRAKYRVAFRKRVWYYPIFRFLLNATVVNGWLYVRKIKSMTQLEFTQEIVSSLLVPSASLTKNHIPRQISTTGRYDGLNHNVVMGKTQRRCGVCKKNVRPMCTKCDVALHIECWLQYHTP